jgi:TatD DNase family protein
VGIVTEPVDATIEWFDSHGHLQDEYLAGGPTGTDPVAGGPTGTEPVAGGPTGTEPGGTEPGGVVGLVLARAFEAGVRRIVCVGTDAATSAQGLSLAADVRRGRFGPVVPETWATAGLHPHEASAGTAAIEALLAEAVDQADGTLVGVGECGLEYHYEHSPRADQRRVFARQITLAHRYRLALVVHARSAWDDVFAIFGTEGVPERTVLHCFTGGPDEAARCLELGMFLSFSGIITFKNAAEVRAAAAACPPARLLVETDSPFLAPVPFRGRTNEPALVPLVGVAVAEITGRPVAEVAATSTTAARQVFGV